MLAVLSRVLILIVMTASALLCASQETPPAEKPQVKVNVLNVCTPSADEQGEIASALEQIPRHPSFSPDFEVDRGRSVLDPNSNPLGGSGSNGAEQNSSVRRSGEPASAQFVRIRRDFPGHSTFSNVQYSFSRDREQMVETLVFRMREAKDLLEVSIESRASSVTSPAAMLAVTTPSSRIKLERFGKSSVVLARCTGDNGSAPVDQSAYQNLFTSASAILADYRGLLQARSLVPEELARVGPGTARHKTTAGTHHQ
jgi:hypothetical protein